MKHSNNIIGFLILAFVSLQAVAQKKAIEFKTEKSDNTLSIFGYNNSKEPLDITLVIKDIKMLKGYTKPITKRVPANSKLHFIDLTFQYEVFEYKLSYSYKKVPTDIDNKIASYNKKDHYLKDVSKINEGIVVFDDEGCSRCRTVTNYLVAHDMDFKIVDLSQGDANNNLMWKMVKEKGVSLKVKAPVIMVDGKLSHSHQDLNAFLSGLPK